MRTHALLLGLIVLTAGLTGCIGQADGTETESPGDEVEPTNATTPDDPTAADPERTWTNETFEGSVTGFNIPMVGSGNLQGETMQSFQVEPGIDVLYLNLTTEGGELRMNVADPDCQPSATAACEETVTTSGGEASYVNASAASGEWNVRLFASGPVAQGVSYTLEVVQAINATAAE